MAGPQININDVFDKTSNITTNQANSHTTGAGLFQVLDREVSFNIFQQTLKYKYPYLKPTEPINIHKNFYWSNPTTDKSEVPYVDLVEYELTWGQTVTNIQRVIEATKTYSKTQTLDPYLTMYSAKPTGFNYRLPHLLGNGSVLREISNSWSSKNDFNFFKAAGDFAKNISKVGQGLSSMWQVGEDIARGVLPGFGFEETSNFIGSSNRTLTITFPLYNTIDTKSAFKNYCFCLMFAFQNLKTRTTFMTHIPPKIYQISNDGYNGGVYMPVAVVSKFSVEGVGTTRVLNDFSVDGLTNGKIIIPEAYKITIEFQELISQSSNIMLGSMGGKKVTFVNDDAINEVGDVIQNIS